MQPIGVVDGDGTDGVDDTTHEEQQQQQQQEGREEQGMKMTISLDATQQVINQLLRMGHFHTQNDDGNIILDGETTTEPDDDYDSPDDDDLDAYRRWEKDQAVRPVYSWESEDCQIIPTKSHDRYYTHKGLVSAMVEQLPLTSNGTGRASINDLCHSLDIDYDSTNKAFFGSTKDGTKPSASSQYLIGPFQKYLPQSITVLKQVCHSVELISESYWEQLQEDIATEVTTKGSIQLSDLCTRYSLPKDTLMNNVITKLVNERDGVAKVMDDSMRLVSSSVCKDLQEQVIAYFATLTEPVQISVVCQDHDNWDVKQVIEWLHGACRTENIILHGDVHMDSGTTTSQSAVYIPTVYRKQQEKAILDFIAVNGYITSAHRNGVSAGRMISIVRETYPDATVLIEDDVIILESTFQHIQVGIQDYLSSSSSFESKESLDLSDYLPAELVQSHIIPLMLEKIGITPEQGVVVVAEDQAMLVNNSLVQQIKDNKVSKLIDDFAKVRAEQIFKRTTTGEYDNDEEDVTAKAGSRKGGGASGGKSTLKRTGKVKHTSHKNPNIGDKVRTMGLVPLSHVANTILQDYPSFLGQDSSTTIPDNVTWEASEDDGRVNGISNNLVVEFCRQAFYTDKFRLQCERAIRAELERLQSERDSKARLSRKDAAAKIRSVESSFEEAFVTLCYLIQSQAKFIVFASTAETFNDKSIEILKAELLQGPCADLTSRITQHCLFQEEQSDIFSFIPIDNSGGDGSFIDSDNRNDGNLPQFCSPVETTARRYSKTYLSCPPPRQPLAVLRESFSGNSGIVLSRQWILCGGECYLGGIVLRTTVPDEEDGNNHNSDHHDVVVRPGNLDGFLSHVETNCLTLCGLPFKKLDKKAEKNFLFTRKQQLTSNLVVLTTGTTGEEPDSVAILEYTIMILFQQVRNLVVSGSLLRGPILKTLADERKIPKPVSTALMKLNDAIDSDQGGNVDNVLLNLVKECGLCRDIAKYDTTAIEEYLSKVTD